MKRYEISAAILAGTVDIPELYVDEEPDGEWVRAEYALKLQAVVANLPKCEICRAHVATRRSGCECAEFLFCDVCSGPRDAVELPYAEVLRALESSRETKGSG